MTWNLAFLFLGVPISLRACDRLTADFPEFRTNAVELLHETDKSLALPRDAVVFLFHQGYQFCFVEGSGGSDGPVMLWVEAELEPSKTAETFAGLVNAELDLMEQNVPANEVAIT